MVINNNTLKLESLRPYHRANANIRLLITGNKSILIILMFLFRLRRRTIKGFCSAPRIKILIYFLLTTCKA